MRYIGFDIESTRWDVDSIDRTQLQFRLGCFIEFNKEFHEIKRSHVTTQKAFTDFVLSLCNAKNPAILWAHNLDFDVLFCIPILLEYYECRPIINGKMISVKFGKSSIRKNGKKDFRKVIEFRNTFALYPAALRKIGQEFGLVKLENSLNSIDSGKLTDSDIEYCYRDCEILLKMLETRAIDLEPFYEGRPTPNEIPLTAASCAFKKFAFHNSRMDETGRLRNVFALLLQALHEEFKLRFFFGGRTEAFDLRKAFNVIYYDINSLYPYVMIKHKFHAPNYYWHKYANQTMEELLVDNFLVGVEAYIVENEDYPLIPVRGKDKSVLFKNGRKQAFLFPEEIEYLLERGSTIEIIRTLSSPNEPVYCFSYMLEMYESRAKDKAEGKNANAYVKKIDMNSTYGRMGMELHRKNKRITPVSSVNEEWLIDNWETEIVPVNGLFIQSIDSNLQSDVNSIVATRITALARLEITKLIHKVTAAGYIVYYCDTDSIVCEENAICESLCGKGLGQLKREKDFIWFQAIGAKEYVGVCVDPDEKEKKPAMLMKLKGCPIKTTMEMKRYHSNKGLKIARPAKLNEQLIALKSMKQETIGAIQRTIVKAGKTFYKKRVVLEDLTTRPLFEEEETDNSLSVLRVLSKLSEKTTRWNRVRPVLMV